MAFTDRISEHPNRVVLTEVSGETDTYEIDFESAQGTVSQEGTSLTATEMNDAVNDLIDSALNGVNITTGGSLIARNIQSGTVYFQARVNTTQSASVTFPQAFENPPHITMCPQTTGPNVCFCSVANITTTGFTAYFHRTNNYATTVHWIAIGS